MRFATVPAAAAPANSSSCTKSLTAAPMNLAAAALSGSAPPAVRACLLNWCPVAAATGLTASTRWHEDAMPPPRALRPAAVPEQRHGAGDSVFHRAVEQVQAGLASQAAARPEVSFDSEPPPRRLAPQAMAIAAAVEIAGTEIGVGRFVLLYDPAGQDGWAGPFRVIAYLQAELEPEIAADPFIGQVGWSWLIEALDARPAGYAASSGSVTRVVTEGFGAKQDQPVATEFEMRASWSPLSDGKDSYALDRHVAAWEGALCGAGGLPPLPPGIPQLPPPPSRPAQLRPAPDRPQQGRPLS